MIFSCKPDFTSFPSDPLMEWNVFFTKWKTHHQFFQGLIHEMETRYSTDTLAFDIPMQLGGIEKMAPEVEIIKSNTLQPLKLFYQHNIVNRSIAYIFVNTKCNGLPYENALKKGKHASRIFNEILEFKEVLTLTDYKREEIIEKLNHLKQRSKDFADEIKKKNE